MIFFSAKAKYKSFHGQLLVTEVLYYGSREFQLAVFLNNCKLELARPD